MARGTKLQEMEQSKTAVNANAAPAEPMGKLKDPGEGLSTSWEDLGGPTPENYSPTNDSAKLKPAGGTLKQVKDVVNKGAVKAEPMGKLKNAIAKEEEEMDAEATLEETPTVTDEVVEEDVVEAEETVEDSGDARIRAKVRERLRKPGAPAPTIAEMASIMGLRPAPCAVAATIQDTGGEDVNIVPEKKQTLLAPLPDPTDWQKPRKEGRRRSSTGSGSSSDAHVSGNDRATAEAAAQPTSGAKRSKVKASTSSRKRKKPKKSSSSGAGSSFMHKLRRKKDKGDRYHTQTDEEDEQETYRTKPSSSGKSDRRIFDQTPKRKDENLTQTSIHDMFASGRK